ncbi:MAG: hypothetical protein HN967_12680 [Candidatus Marinimicrobia bacterium]|nr:hypothetical protein [Candidatus Neomarinimicrobiota bacterium]
MNISKKELRTLLGDAYFNSYLKFINELYISSFNKLKFRVDLNFDIACNFDYFVSWEKYSRQLKHGWKFSNIWEDIFTEENVGIKSIMDEYKLGQYDNTIELPLGGIYVHFIIEPYSLENIYFLTEGILHSYLPEFNCYTFINYSGRNKIHITADIVSKNYRVDESIDSLPDDKYSENFIRFLIRYHSGEKYENLKSNYPKFLEDNSISIEELSIFEYCTGIIAEDELNKGPQSALIKSMEIFSDILESHFNEDELTKTSYEALSIGTDGIIFINKFALICREIFSQNFPNSTEDRMNLYSQEGKLEEIVQATIQNAFIQIVDQYSKDDPKGKKNCIILIPGLRYNNRQINIIIYYDDSGNEHVLQSMRNASFDFLYYLAWLSNSNSTIGLKSTHSLSTEEIQSFCPEYVKFNRFMTGWVKVIMGQERPLKSRSDMKAEINKYFKRWFKNGIIEITPREEFVILSGPRIELLEYGNDDYLKWIEKTES